jgi:hypothetical protein
MEETDMSKPVESPPTCPQHGAGTLGVLLVVGRALGTLVAEHSRAQRAAIWAALPRQRRADLRALYTAVDGKYFYAAAKRTTADDAFQSPAASGLLRSGSAIAALVLVLSLIVLLVG